MEIFGENNHSKYKIEWREVDVTKANEIKEIILKNYDVDAIGKGIAQVKEWERMSNNFRVNVKMKGKWRLVLFRKNIRLSREDSVALRNKIMDFLKRENVPVPTAIVTKQRKTFFQSEKTFYEMHDFVAGDHYRGTRKELERAAQGIAKLHRVLNKISFKEEIKKNGITLSPWTVEKWNEIFSQAKKERDDIDMMVLENKALLLGEIEKIQKGKSQIKKLKKQIIHTDLHPQNMIFQKEKLSAIIDFEGAREGELLRDIGNACHRFVRQFVVYQKKDFHKILGEGIRIFLREYNKINPIEKQGFIPLLISDELLRKLQSDIGAYYFENNPSRVEGGELKKKLILLEESKIIADFIQ